MTKPELFGADNQTMRVPTVLVLDRSGSTAGDPIAELNAGLVVFKKNVEQDEQASLAVDLAVVTFGATVDLIHDFSSIEDFTPPVLVASGGTPMGQAIMTALDRVEERKKCYHENAILYYRPWVFLITDGYPTDAWNHAAQRVHEWDKSNKCLFFCIGVQSADMNTLAQISPHPPVKLQGLAFTSLFALLGNSASTIAKSTPAVGRQIQSNPFGGSDVVQPFHSSASR